jgi:hypothetical protein
MPEMLVVCMEGHLCILVVIAPPGDLDPQPRRHVPDALRSTSEHGVVMAAFDHATHGAV